MKRGGLAENKVAYPGHAGEVILTGSLIYVGNPLYKCPDATGKREPEIDLSLVNEDYLPRTHYARAIDLAAYSKGIPSLEWDREDIPYRYISDRFPEHA